MTSRTFIWKVQYRIATRVIATLDATDAMVKLSYSSGTFFTEEVEGKEEISSMSTPTLGLFSYILLMACIGAFAVNALQLVMALMLYRNTSKKSARNRTIVYCRLWIKNSFLLSILLISKLFILYNVFRHAPNVGLTMTLCIYEFVGRIVGTFIILGFLRELLNIPTYSTQVYYHGNPTDATHNLHDVEWI